jgi:hypothetical protein
VIENKNQVPAYLFKLLPPDCCFTYFNPTYLFHRIQGKYSIFRIRGKSVNSAGVTEKMRTHIILLLESCTINTKINTHINLPNTSEDGGLLYSLFQYSDSLILPSKQLQ